MSSREIYASSNGDRWFLRRDGDALLVVHEPNAASGGQARTMAVAAFLTRDGETPQGRALLDLVASLLHNEGDLNDAQRTA